MTHDLEACRRTNFTLNLARHGDRDIDADIAVSFGRRVKRAGSWRWFNETTRRWEALPHWSSDIDAALDLLPVDDLTYYILEFRQTTSWNKKPFAATLYEKDPGCRMRRSGYTSALAICTAVISLMRINLAIDAHNLAKEGHAA